MMQNKKTLALCLATAMMLAACGGEEEGSNDNSRPDNSVTKPDAPDTSGGDPGNAPTNPVPDTAEDWKEYKTIADRCALISGLQKYHLDDINCLRGVFRGKLGNDDGRSCEIEFMGTDGLRMTVAGNSYTYVPKKPDSVWLPSYRNTSNTKPRLSGDRSFMYEKELHASLRYAFGAPTAIFWLYNGKYDANYWRRNGNGDRPIDFPSYINLIDFPADMGEALNIPLTYIGNIGYLRTTFIIESATFY